MTTPARSRNPADSETAGCSQYTQMGRERGEVGGGGGGVFV